MSHQRLFNRRLDRLYEKKTAWLRTALTKAPPGPIPNLTKPKRERGIKELRRIASDALAKKMAKRAFERSVARKKTWKTKGRGIGEKRKGFRAWLVREGIDPKSGKVYVFWHKKKCLYVGRTTGKGARPIHHFKRAWFGGTTRIDVYIIPRQSDVPRLECLGVHRFHPTRNKVRAAKEKWTKRCPLCSLHKRIKNEVRDIFRFR